jgi:adenosylhomocysteine nucleosidase
VALREEAVPLWRRLEHRRWVRDRGLSYGEGLLGGRPVLLTRSGMGRSCAEAAAAALASGVRLSGLCAAGFAGALCPNLVPGDLLWATSILTVPDPEDAQVEASFDGMPALDALPPLAAPEPRDGERLPVLHEGALVTTDRVLVWAERKRALAANFAECGRLPLAVDMESAGVAAAAAERRLPFLALRAITDAAEEDLPLDFGRCIGRRGEMRAGNLAAQIARRPAVIREVLRLGHTSIAASVRLADFLARVALQLP